MAFLIGIAGSLFGVVVGAFLTKWIDAAYERRREVVRTVVSAVILHEELEDIRASFRAMAEMRELVSSYLMLGAEEWESHRSLFIAAGMAHTDWKRLASIFRDLLEIREAMRPLISESEDQAVILNDKNAEWMSSLARQCEEGQSLLRPFVREVPIPLLRPERIFKAA